MLFSVIAHPEVDKTFQNQLQTCWKSTSTPKNHLLFAELLLDLEIHRFCDSERVFALFLINIRIFQAEMYSSTRMTVCHERHRFQKTQSPRLLGAQRKIGYCGVANHLKFIGKLSRGRGNARNSAQIKIKYFCYNYVTIS